MALMRRGALFAGALFAGVLFGPRDVREQTAQSAGHVVRPLPRRPIDEDEALLIALLL